MKFSHLNIKNIFSSYEEVFGCEKLIIKLNPFIRVRLFLFERFRTTYSEETFDPLKIRIEVVAAAIKFSNPDEGFRIVWSFYFLRFFDAVFYPTFVAHLASVKEQSRESIKKVSIDSKLRASRSLQWLNWGCLRYCGHLFFNFPNTSIQQFLTVPAIRNFPLHSGMDASNQVVRSPKPLR